MTLKSIKIFFPLFQSIIKNISPIYVHIHSHLHACEHTYAQVTDALSYLHDEANIIHNDLRCSNILVFKFSPIGHDCLKGTVNSGCALCFPDGGDCSVLVKVADMGICVNPATQKTKNMQGIRHLIPECLNFNAALTEKVQKIQKNCLQNHSKLSPPFT